MTITSERAEKLAGYLNADRERALKLLDLPVAEACAKINADGYDFCEEELQEFDLALQYAVNSATEGELSEDALENVVGGLGVLEAMAIIGGAAAACEWAWNTGAKIGKWLGKKIYG